MHSSYTKWAALALAMLAAGCGGGGGSDLPRGLSSGDGGSGQNTDAATVRVAVQLFDSIAGLQRLLPLEPAAAQILAGPAGLPVVRGCLAGGNVTLRKTSATVATVVAANCVMDAADGLLYNGTWTLTQTASSYSANGSCPVATACTWQGTADLSTARFGYGTAAALQVTGRDLAVATSAAGFTTYQVTAAAETLTVEGVTGAVNGTPAQVSLDAGGTRYTVGGVAATTRTGLTVTSPVSAALTLGQDVTASIDRDFDGTVDANVVVPWSTFAD
jgi:hypothetical protein